jgi:hypothetical protein
MMFKRFLIVLSLLVLVGAPVVHAQEAPQAVYSALSDLSTRLGTNLALSDLAAWSWSQQNFPDSSLGCPRPGLRYNQVVTNGFQVLLTYNGVVYDYRVTADAATVFLCSPTGDGTTQVVQPTPEQVVVPAQPAQPAQPVQSTGQVVCPGGLATRLAVGMQAQAIATGSINIRAQPSTTAQVAGLLLPNEPFAVVGGPRCADNFTWWNINYQSKVGLTSGWVTEGDNVEYWIMPVGGAPAAAPATGLQGVVGSTPITLSNAAQVTLLVAPVNISTLGEIQRSNFLPPPSSDVILVTEGGQFAYYGDGATQATPGVDHSPTRVFLMATARRAGTTLVMATAEQNPNDPNSQLLLVFETQDVTTNMLQQRYGFQIPSIPNSLAISPDGRWMAAGAGSPMAGPGSPDNALWIWDLTTGAQVVSMPFTGAVGDLAFSPDSTLLAVGEFGVGTGVHLWSLTTQSAQAVLPCEPGWRGTTSMDFSPDGARLAVGSEDGTIHIFDIATATESNILQVPPTGNPVWFVAFSPDGSLLATADGQPMQMVTTGIFLWNPVTGAQVARLDHPETLSGLQFSTDGRQLISVGTNTLQIYGTQ